MSINFYQVSGETFHVKHKLILKRWLKELISHYALASDEINIILVSDEKLIEMNAEHLRHNYYTDIITFDYSQNGRVSGDLYISIDRIKENARNFAVSAEHELWRVIAHGVLHLAGLKDKNKKDQEQMRAAENLWLKKLEGMLPVEQKK